MATRNKKRLDLNFDKGLLVLLIVSMITSFVVLVKFRRFEKEIKDVNLRNLEILKQESKRNSAELLKVLNSGLINQDSSVHEKEDVKLGNESRSESKFDGEPCFKGEKNRSFSSLPHGLSICRNGVFLLTDGINSYDIGELSPVGVITNISQGVVQTDIGNYYYISNEHKTSINKKLENGGSYD